MYPTGYCTKFLPLLPIAFHLPFLFHVADLPIPSCFPSSDSHLDINMLSFGFEKEKKKIVVLFTDKRAAEETETETEKEAPAAKKAKVQDSEATDAVAEATA